MSKAMDAAVRGALGGVAGGLAMYGMKQTVAPKVLPKDMRREGFAPKKAVEWAEETAGHPDVLTEDQEMKAAMAAHLAYSAGFGALYGLVRRRADGVPAPLAGALFGLAVWKVSFDGWMPALGIMEATTEMPMKKWPPDIMGHAIYGAATALAYEALENVLD
jgi:uncharacterized membrane protein YagU involved in acid resistance